MEIDKLVSLIKQNTWDLQIFLHHQTQSVDKYRIQIRQIIFLNTKEKFDQLIQSIEKTQSLKIPIQVKASHALINSHHIDQLNYKRKISDKIVNKEHLKHKKPDNLELDCKNLKNSLHQEKVISQRFEPTNKKLETELQHFKQENIQLETKCKRLEADIANRDSQIQSYHDEIIVLNQKVNDFKKNKKEFEERLTIIENDIKTEHDKNTSLDEAKKGVEQFLKQIEINIENEKFEKSTLSQINNQLVNDLKMATSQIENLLKTNRVVENLVTRKQNELDHLISELEDERFHSLNANKIAKHLEHRLNEVESEIENLNKNSSSLNEEFKQREMSENIIDNKNKKEEYFELKKENSELIRKLIVSKEDQSKSEKDIIKLNNLNGELEAEILKYKNKTIKKANLSINFINESIINAESESEEFEMPMKKINEFESLIYDKDNEIKNLLNDLVKERENVLKLEQQLQACVSEIETKQSVSCDAINIFESKALIPSEQETKNQDLNQIHKLQELLKESKLKYEILIKKNIELKELNANDNDLEKKREREKQLIEVNSELKYRLNENEKKFSKFQDELELKALNSAQEIVVLQDKVSELERFIEEKSKENNKLLNDLETSHKNSIFLNETIQKLELKITEKEVSSLSDTTETNSLKDGLTKAKQEIEELKKIESEIENSRTIEEFKTINSELEQLIISKTKENKNILNDLENLNEKLNQLQIIINEQQNLISIKTIEVIKLKDQSLRSEQEIKDLKDLKIKHEVQILSLKSCTDSSNTEDSINEIKLRISVNRNLELEQSITSKTNENKILLNDLDKLRDNIVELESRVNDSALLDAKQSGTLNSLLESPVDVELKKKINDLESKLDNKGDEIKNLSNDLEKDRESTKQLQIRLNETEQQRSKLFEEMERLCREFEENNQLNETKFKSNFEINETLKFDLIEEIKQLNLELNSTKEQLKKLTLINSQLQTSESKHQIKSTTLNDNLANDKKINDLKRNIENLDSKLFNCCQEKEEILLKLSKADTEIKSQEIQIKSHQEEIKSLNSQVLDLQRITREQELIFSDKEDKLKRKFKAENEKLSKDLKESIEKCQNENNVYYNELAIINQKFNKLSELNTKLAAEKENLKTEYEKLQTTLYRLESQLNLSKNEIKEFKQKNSEMCSQKAKSESIGAKLMDSNRLIGLRLAEIDYNEKNLSRLDSLVKSQDAEITNLKNKLEQEQTELQRALRKAQVLQDNLKETENEVIKERNARNKIERQKSELARKLEEMDKELENSTNSKALLNDTTIRTENEINKLKRELDDLVKKHEAKFAQLRAVHEETVNEMSGRIAQLIRAINKLEKEKLQLESEYGPISEYSRASSRASSRAPSLAPSARRY